MGIKTLGERANTLNRADKSADAAGKKNYQNRRRNDTRIRIIFIKFAFSYL